MSPVLGAMKFYVVAAALRDAVYTGLTNQPERYGVVPGAIAWDACDCGQMAVAISRTYLSDTFPTPETEMIGNCQSAWEVSEYVVQVIRCAPGPDGQGNPPTTDAEDLCAQLVTADAFEAMTAAVRLLCSMKDGDLVTDFLVVDQMVQGPEGGCVGTELRLLVALPRG